MLHLSANNISDNNCKRIKGNNSDKMFTDTDACDIKWRNQRTESEAVFNVGNSEIIEDTVECTASITKISSPSSSASQKNDIFKQTGMSKVDEAYAIIESNHHSKINKSIPKIASPQSNENNSVKLYTPVIQSGNPIYYSVPPSNIFYTRPVSSLTNLGNESAATLYATTSSNVIRPPVIQNTVTISKRQSLVAETITPDVVTNNSEEAGGSSDLQAELLKEKTVDGSPAGNNSSRIVVSNLLKHLKNVKLYFVKV